MESSVLGWSTETGCLLDLMILDVFTNLNDSMMHSTFSPWIPHPQGDAPPGWVFTGALTCEIFQSLSHTHISTAPVAAPPWVLQEHTLREGCVKHRWPDHMGPALCENRLWWPGLPFPISLLAVPALCASSHWEYKATVCPSIHCCLGHQVTPVWLRGAGCPSLPSSCHPYSNLQPLQTSVLQL